MLMEVNRLKSDRDFKRVFKNGRTLENQFFRIKFFRNQKNINRFGFVVSNKISNKATIRNTLKRRLRSASRYLTENRSIGFDIVIWPKTEAIKLKYVDLSYNLRVLINKL